MKFRCKHLSLSISLSLSLYSFVCYRHLIRGNRTNTTIYIYKERERVRKVVEDVYIYIYINACLCGCMWITPTLRQCQSGQRPFAVMQSKDRRLLLLSHRFRRFSRGNSDTYGGEADLPKSMIYYTKPRSFVMSIYSCVDVDQII